MFLKKILRVKNTLLFRLTILYAGIFTLSTLLIFLYLYFRIQAMAIEDIDQELLHEISKYSESLDEDGREAVRSMVIEEGESEDPEEDFFRLILLDGKVLAETDMSSWGPPDMYAIPHEILTGEAGHVIRTVTVPGREDSARMISALIAPDTVLQIGETLEDTEAYLQVFRGWFFMLLFFAMIFSAITGWYMGKRALQDMEEVTRTASEISNGVYDKRVKVREQFDEIIRLGATFNDMLDRIQKLIISMREVNDNIAHDLRSPLARIRGIAEMSLISERSIEEYRNMAASTIEECDNLSEMINTMLDISEAESGVSESKTEQFDLVQIIHEIHELFMPVAAEKKIGIQITLPEDLIFLGDRRKMQRIMGNLLDNALKYTPSGGRISISASEDGDKILITFQDTGIGIAEADLPHIFKRFYRGDTSRTRAGAGLGLSLAKALTEAMNGIIRVKSRIHEGSTFTVELPRYSFTES